MIVRVDHLNIVVADLERSVRFYTEVLGLRETRRAHLEGEWIERIVGLRGVVGDVVYVQPVGGGPRLELLHYRSPKGESIEANRLANTQGLRHIAFQVDDMAEVCGRLAAAGVPLLSPPVRVPTGVVRHDAGSKTLCYFHDPDGVLLELAEYRRGEDGHG